jgi:hypothetical protein
MSGLDELLEAARRADPAARIEFRDRIAAHGGTAIGPMAEWVNDPRLGAFAVRVLQRIASDPASRGAAVAALSAADRRNLSPHVADDLAQALTSLRQTARAANVSTARGASLAPNRGEGRARGEGSRPEERFHDAMLDIYWLAGRATGYWASYFLRGVRNKGGVTEARDLLRRSGTSPGFERLKTERRLDLSMEALVVRPEFWTLFTPSEVEIARQRLVGAGYVPGLQGGS